MNSSLKGKKILFATVPSDGHINPLTGLAKYLQECGCEIRWYTSRIFEEKFKKLEIPHCIFTKALDINPINLDYIFPERKYINDLPEKLNFDLINIFAKRAPEYYADIKSIYQLFPFDLMIADSMFSGIPLVKHILGVPVVSIGNVPLATDSTDLASYGMGLPPAVTPAQHEEYARLRDFVTTALFKRSIEVYDDILKDHHISAEGSILFDMLIKQADLHLQAGIPDFEYHRTDLGENIRFIGTLLPYTIRKHHKTWFDERLLRYNRIVLVTQGSSETETATLIEPVLQAFQDTDTLVIATTGGNGTIRLRNNYTAENLIIESYIPFEEVMPYASVCITNGGYITTLMSISHKLPLISSGIHEGKNEVAARIGYFNCGIDLKTENPSPEAIRRAVHEILSDNKYRTQISLLAEKLKQYHANQLSAGYIAELLSENVEVPEKLS